MASKYTHKIIINIARDFTELVIKELDVINVYLYGSYVKGTYTEDSDIDIAVVSNSFIGDPVEDTMKLMRIRRKVDIELNHMRSKLLILIYLMIILRR